MNNTRIAKWDNLKFIMILCVVTGHFMGEMISGDYLGQAIYVFIYTFHMPVFLFLAGMFSKNSVEQKKYELVMEYMVIYLIMKVLDNLASCLKYSRTKEFADQGLISAIGKSIMKGKDNFHFFWEDGPGWFAFAMAIFIFVTILIQDYNKKTMLAITIFVGCLAGLDKHLGPVSGMGNHFTAMRICVFYPVFLAGYYTDPDIFLDKTNQKSMSSDGKSRKVYVKKSFITIFSILFLLLCLIMCLRLNHSFTLWGKTYQDGFLYSLRDFLKGKCTYYNIGKIADTLQSGKSIEVGIGLWGILARLGSYVVWGILIVAIIMICPSKEYFWSWLGRRTMSVFIWHKFFMVFLLYICNVKNYLYENMEHTYLPATICLATIITILTAYLPGFRISKKMRMKKHGNQKETNIKKAEEETEKE